MLNRPWPVCSALPATLSIFLLVIFALVFALVCPEQIQAQAAPRANPIRRAVIIDTDAGSDDLMAIAFLLSRSDIQVEAITIENGMAHVQAGGKNVLRLLSLAGRADVPVFLGREIPLSGVQEFPEEWRRNSDDLPGINLPESAHSADPRSAEDYLLKRFLDAAHPMQILALGPLTNLGEVFSRSPRAARAGRQLVILGGAIGVSGNLGDGGLFKTDNAASEWNMFIDPVAAKIVFSSGIPIRLVPLDATQQVPIDMALFEQIQSRAEAPLAKFVAQVLATNRDSIRQGFYFARDPLAATVLANPAVVTFHPLAIQISDKPDELGRTIEIKKARANVQVAIDADNLRFRDVFMTALGVK
jgi:pyrimidine-specific ribonucleoside hydrolase